MSVTDSPCSARQPIASGDRIMSNDTIYLPILMYHGIRRSGSDQFPTGWSRRHAIDAASFAAQLEVVARSGLRTLALADLDRPSLSRRPMLITFDDGHSSDYSIAAPELKQRDLTGTFFVTWSFLGRAGYLDRAQVRELRAQSFEIGSHGLSHKRLTEVGPAELWCEALDSKRRLEDLIGEEISSFAVPSGSYNDPVLQALWAAGYRRIMTSDFGYARLQDSAMHRMGVMADTTPRQFQAFLTAGPSWAARHRLLEGVKRRLGQVFARARMPGRPQPVA
jgi:peptidoglycan/xylan/chitin deacetylase (PgdA/CDA1 family)